MYEIFTNSYPQNGKYSIHGALRQHIYIYISNSFWDSVPNPRRCECRSTLLHQQYWGQCLFKRSGPEWCSFNRNLPLAKHTICMQDLEALADEPVRFLTRQEMEDSCPFSPRPACRSFALWPVGPWEDIPQLMLCKYKNTYTHTYIYIYRYVHHTFFITPLFPQLQQDREDSQYPADYDWNSLFPEPDLTVCSHKKVKE